MKIKLGVILLVILFLQMMPASAFAADITVEQSQKIFPRNLENGIQIRSCNFAQDSSFLLAGLTDQSHSLFLKINSLGKLAWKTTISQKWPIYTGFYLFDSRTGGYWGLGFASSKDAAIGEGKDYLYLLKMDSKGNPLKQFRLPSIEKNDINCGMQVNDGLIFTGSETITCEDTSTASDKSYISIPLIEKTSEEGKILWKTVFPHGDKDVLQVESSLQCPNNSRTLIKSSSGTIVWATTARLLAFKYINGRIVLSGNEPLIPRMATVVLAVDQNGREIHKIILPGADRSFIFPAENGYVLIEHFKPRLPEFVAHLSMYLAVIPIRFAASIDGGIRITKLDTNLRVVRINEYKIPSLSDKIGDAIQEGKDYFIAGCNVDSEQVLVHVNDDSHKFELNNIYPSNNGIRQCADFGWTKTSEKNVFNLYAGNQVGGYRIMTVRYNP